MADPVVINFMEEKPFWTFDLVAADTVQYIYLPKSLITLVHLGVGADGITVVTDNILIVPDSIVEVGGYAYNYTAGLKLPIYPRSSIIFNGNDMPKDILHKNRTLCLKALTGTVKCAIVRGAWSPLVR